MKSSTTHTPPPKIEDLGDGSSFYNFDVIESVGEEGEAVFDYDQVRVANPVTFPKVKAALLAEGYEHEPDLSENHNHAPSPDPDDEEIIVPQVITSRQLRLQWVMSGHDLSDIDNAIDQLPEAHKEIARINWEYAGTFDRYNQLLLNVADSLEITPEQLDELFILASAL